ncbi:MAG: hypothetical protein L3J06_03670 [Cyclobacteriaceae bacterium]|nr:hypothetical protein [Cyclobacteriaceae bacterium]
MSIELQYPYSYKLQLVKTTKSAWVLFIALFGGLALAVVLAVIASHYFSANRFIGFFFIGGFLLLFMIYGHVLMIKYWSNVSFFDTHFEVGGVKYNWNDVEWFANNRGSKFSLGLVIGLKGGSKEIRIFVASKSGKNLDECVDMMEAFKNIIHQKSIQTRNYYNTPKWRLLARLLILSNLLPLTMLLFGNVETGIMVLVTFSWIFISLIAPMIIYANQD